MTNNTIQRYTPSEIYDDFKDAKYIRESDHIKAMEAQAKEIEQLKREKAALETAVIAQGMGL